MINDVLRDVQQGIKAQIFHPIIEAKNCTLMELKSYENSQRC